VARGSGALAKSYVLLPLIFGLALASACIASPFVKILNDGLAKTRPLGKIFTQCVVVFAFVYFLVFRRHMRSRVLESLNKQVATLLGHLLAGILIGALILCIIIGIFYVAGAKDYDPDFTVGLIWNALLIGLVVGLIEEIVFRGVVLQNLHADMKAFFAVLFASAFFAAMHFIQPLPAEIVETGSAPAFNEFHILNGFRILPSQFANFGHFGQIWPFFLGLFLIGAALSVAYVHTRTLYLSIGIHAGFVAVNKLDGALFTDVAGRSKLLFGVARDWYMSYTDSLICWLATAALIVLLMVFAGRPRRGSTDRGKR
jgi:membrane protease YdiL (CAAX protease family)